jgi:hypothetical protein
MKDPATSTTFPAPHVPELGRRFRRQRHDHQCQSVAENDYNDIFTRGARAALRLHLGDNWTITPTVMTQEQKSYGNFAGDDHLGDYKVNKYYPEYATDDWTRRR